MIARIGTLIQWNNRVANECFCSKRGMGTSSCE